ncbi:MAG: von Willebrand factor type A domain-containing protein [Polyangiaceae bacterium]|nr:von Willebrand factor type A domain-containing protein [Polyangiaceae bacterium]
MNIRITYLVTVGLLGALSVGCSEDSDSTSSAGDSISTTDSGSVNGFDDNESGYGGSGSSTGGTGGYAYDMGSSSGGSGSGAELYASPPEYASADSGTADPIIVEVPEEPRTNPFTLVSSDPLSTFAADVDTASYDIFVRDIGNGYLPQAVSVRLEEFVNFFHYDYEAPAADAEQPFAVHLDAAPSLLDKDTINLRVGIQAEQPPPSEMLPANIVFLVDTSGSMSGDLRLPLVQLVMTESLEVLAPTDTVSIVTYAGRTTVALTPTPVSDSDTILSAINSFSAGGSTAGGSGINLAYDQASAGFIDGGINQVILMTDGDFNVGVSSDTDLTTLIEEKRQSGVMLSVLGFGSYNNDSMMESISNAGNGTYAVIGSEGSARSYVEDRLLSNLHFVAQDMKIQVEFNPAHVLAYRLLGYENRAIADNLFRDDTVDAGEIGAGHQVTALYELVLPGGTIPVVTDGPEFVTGEGYAGDVEVGADDMVSVKVRYKDVGATEAEPAYEVASSLAPAAIGVTLDAADGDLQWAVAVAAFAELLKESPYAAGINLDRIEGIIASHAGTDSDRTAFEGYFLTAKGLLGL